MCTFTNKTMNKTSWAGYLSKYLQIHQDIEFQLGELSMSFNVDSRFMIESNSTNCQSRE
jgi:hypothetical protein